VLGVEDDGLGHGAVVLDGPEHQAVETAAEGHRSQKPNPPQHGQPLPGSKGPGTIGAAANGVKGRRYGMARHGFACSCTSRASPGPSVTGCADSSGGWKYNRTTWPLSGSRSWR